LRKLSCDKRFAFINVVFLYFVHKTRFITFFFNLFFILIKRWTIAVQIGLNGIGRPELRSGRAYVLPQMFSFFSQRFLRDPSTDRPEALPHDQNLAVF